MQIAVATFKLKPGITEEALLAASDDFETGFAQRQEGIIRRDLVRSASGGYGDIVLFESPEAMATVLGAEQSDPVCAAYMTLMEDDDYTEFQVLKTYR